jgi:hypothetical protein
MKTHVLYVKPRRGERVPVCSVSDDYAAYEDVLAGARQKAIAHAQSTGAPLPEFEVEVKGEPKNEKVKS